MKTPAFLIPTIFACIITTCESDKNFRHHPTHGVSPTVKLLNYEPDCKPDWTDRPPNNGSMWRCFNYVGRLGYNAPCDSDDTKREKYMEYLDPRQDGSLKEADSEQKLRTELDAHSCNTTQYLECRRISGKDSQTPQYRCACPDHEKGDSPDATAKNESYFDFRRNICVLKVGGKCANLTIPDDDKRLNGSRRYLTKHMKDVVDGRRQWLTLPCVENAKCHTQEQQQAQAQDADINGTSIVSAVPWIDPSKNRCTCESGFIIEDGALGECIPIDGTGHLGLLQSKGPYPLAVLLFIIIFALTLWFIVGYGDHDLYYAPGYTNYR